MQRSARVNRDFPRCTGAPGRGRLASFFLLLALFPQLISLGAWDAFESLPAGAALLPGETAADAGPASCELGSPSCAVTATAAAPSVALLAATVVLVTVAALARRRPGAPRRLHAIGVAPPFEPPRPALLPR